MKSGEARELVVGRVEQLSDKAAQERREGWVLVPVAKAVRDAVERHREEVAWRAGKYASDTCDARRGHVPMPTVDEVLDCLLALVEDREWPGGGE